MSVQSQHASGAEHSTVEAQVGRGLSIIIPTYNERMNVEQIVSRCLAAFDDYRVEVLVVDDSSPDGTADHAAETFEADERVRVLRRTLDKGLAQSVTHGFRQASFEYCAVIDADLQHPPEGLPGLVRALETGADVAIGSRHLPGGGIENWSRGRGAISRCATIVTRVVLPSARPHTDPLSGFFAVRRSVLADVALDPKGYKILLEVLTKGDYETVVEVPYVFREREFGESKLTAGEYKNFVEHLGALVVTSYGLDEVVEPYRAVRGVEFGAIGALGTIVNMLVFSAILLGVDAHYLVAGAVAFVVAVNVNFLGNWAITFDRPAGDLLSKYLRFNAVSVTGFVFYSVLLVAFITLLGLHALLGNLGAIVGASIFNFIGTERFAFGARHPEE